MPVKSSPILIASDHAGFALKAALVAALKDVGWEDLGPPSAERVDYPDFAEKLALRIAEGSAEFGVLVCGSGIGMSISANKVPGVRAAAVGNPVAARLSREHNHANVLCLGSRFVAPEYAEEIVRAWLATPFSKEGRHAARVKKIEAQESRYCQPLPGRKK